MLTTRLRYLWGRNIHRNSTVLASSFEGKMKFVCRLNGATWCWRFNLLSTLFVCLQTNFNADIHSHSRPGANSQIQYLGVYIFKHHVYHTECAKQIAHCEPHWLLSTAYSQINPAVHWLTDWLVDWLRTAFNVTTKQQNTGFSWVFMLSCCCRWEAACEGHHHQHLPGHPKVFQYLNMR